MFDLIVIGGGMAGMTSAIYALREKKTVLVIERESIGGQITQSPKVQNYPTYTEISGSELADKAFEHMTALGGEFEVENVEKIEKENDIFTIKTDYNTYQAKAVVVATGLKHRMLDLDEEEKYIGRGIYYCAICDGPFFAGQEVAVIGGGNSALQYAIMLSSYCSKVHMFVWENDFTGEKALVDKVRATQNIEATFGVKSTKLNGTDKLESVEFEKIADGSKFLYNANAVFVAVGQEPKNDIFAKLVDLDVYGYIVTDEKCQTTCEGMFAAGDCRQKTVRQVATAVGDGAIAGTFACRYIDMNMGKLWKS